MSRRRQNKDYTRIPQDDVDAADSGDSVESQQEGFTASQFNRPPPKIPYKAISLSIFLFIVGSVSRASAEFAITDEIYLLLISDIPSLRHPNSHGHGSRKVFRSTLAALHSRFDHVHTRLLSRSDRVLGIHATARLQL